MWIYRVADCADRPSGAAAGLAVGACTSVGAVLVAALADLPSEWMTMLLAQPTAWTVPLAFAVMITVSLFGRAPDWAEHALLRLHSP